MKRMLKKIRKFSWSGKLSLLIIFSILFIVIFTPYLTKYSYRIPSGEALEAPSNLHILGTDDLGIDLWSQICHGARISILVGLGTALLAGVGGSIIGMLSGYFGGIADKILMRFTDMMIALPDLPVMIVMGAFFGSSLKNIIIVLTLFSWTMPARLVRSKVIYLKEESYIKVARSYGAGFWYITYKHFIPHSFPLIMVSIIKLISKAIVFEASLSFLGLGDPTSKSWGLILHHALNFKGIYFTDYWKWWIISPLVAITSMVIAIAFISREFEKIIDTKI